MPPTKKRKTKPRTTKLRSATVRDVSFTADQPSEEQNRQFMLLTLERTFRTLMRAAQELTKRLADPGEPRTEIETALAESGIARQAVLAKHDAIQNGAPFAFPSAAELEKLREAMGRLESGIAQTAATESVINATSEVVKVVRELTQG